MPMPSLGPIDRTRLVHRLSHGHVVPVAGIADVVTAARAAVAGDAVVVCSPKGAVESLGPGWPRALADGVARAWAAEAAGAGEGAAPLSVPSVVLVMDCGPALGLALAALEDWPAPAGWTLALTLDPDVHPAALAALAARGERVGVIVVAHRAQKS